MSLCVHLSSSFQAFHSRAVKGGRRHLDARPRRGDFIRNIHIRVSVGLPSECYVIKPLIKPLLCISVDIQLICSLVKEKKNKST